MKFIVPIVAIGLLTASIFGFAGMTHVNMNCDPGSPTSTCPPSQIGMAFHHISSYTSFMQAIVSPATNTLIALIAFALIAFWFLWQTSFNPKSDIARHRPRNELESSLIQKIKISRWLALFENSPSLSVQH